MKRYNLWGSYRVSGFSVTRVQGRGRYFDSFNPAHLTDHLQLSVYTNSEYATQIAKLIVEAAQVDVDSEGLVAVQPVEQLYWIHDKVAAKSRDFIFNPDDAT